MARKTKPSKPLIYVFCEGESEQAYTDYLRNKFADVAVIKRPSATGLFEDADVRFKKDPKFRNSAEVLDREPSYEKGNYEATARIAEKYPTAVKNAEKTLYNLLSDGLLGLEDTDERNRWLHTNCKTFSTVNEAITFLEQLKKI